tara:strand:- start:2213 stop:2572 length:360 start_codon:yes stop_codon:yes gene_type:complete
MCYAQAEYCECGVEIMDKKTEIEVEAAAFRNLVQFLQRKTDVTNEDMMKSAGFCRDCLSHWYQSCAESLGMEVNQEQANIKIYGMSSQEWYDKHVAALAITAKQNPQATVKEESKQLSS